MIKKIPDFTTATVCKRALTGIDATMAEGNHLCSGIIAIFAVPKIKQNNKILVPSGLILPTKIPCLAKSSVPVISYMAIIAGSKNITEEPKRMYKYLRAAFLDPRDPSRAIKG